MPQRSKANNLRNSKLTRKCKIVLDYLLIQSNPVSARDIFYALRDMHTEKISLATTCRSLKTLESLGLILSISSGLREAHFEALRSEKHYHHAICQTCNRTEHVECALESRVKELETRYSFIVNSHILNFFGKCRQCQVAEI